MSNYIIYKSVSFLWSCLILQRTELGFHLLPPPPPQKKKGCITPLDSYQPKS